jgi:hypothetical protein
MDLYQILSVSVGTLVTVVIAHLAVFWVVKTLYPPPPIIQYVPAPAPPTPAFTPPPSVEQHVELPTYEARLPVEAPSEARKGPPPPEDTSIRGKPGLDSPVA